MSNSRYVQTSKVVKAFSLSISIFNEKTRCKSNSAPNNELLYSKVKIRKRL